jgi:hypothetical protein
MSFAELSAPKKILLLAHSLSAMSMFILAIGQFLEMAEQNNLPSDFNNKSSSISELRAKEYFK